MIYTIIKSVPFTAKGEKHTVHVVAVKGRAMCLNTLKWKGEPMPKITKKGIELPKGSCDIVKRGEYYDLLPHLGDTL